MYEPRQHPLVGPGTSIRRLSLHLSVAYALYSGIVLAPLMHRFPLDQ
jgi:hypothetical protein